MELWKLLGILVTLILVLSLLFMLSLFSKVKIENKPFLAQKIAYRKVQGGFKVIKHNQSIYNKRARSLFGKDMNNWPTFRLLYPSNKDCGVFGMIVPPTFHIEEDCLQELGFSLGDLDAIRDAVTIELPMRCKAAMYLGRLRIKNKLAQISKTSAFIEIHDWKHRKLIFILIPESSTGLWNQQ